MFDIGWSEMAVIAIVALIVIGPKELPNALRSVAKWVKQARRLAREFQGGIDQIVREAELDDARKAVQSASTYNVRREIEKTIDPTGDLARAIDPDVPDVPDRGATPKIEAPAALDAALAEAAEAAAAAAEAPPAPAAEPAAQQKSA
ncbi:MAG: Sec-independent protein translocase protein TatB [Dongiaceae bacterium]